MARSEKHIPKTLEDAVAELKRDPSSASELIQIIRDARDLDDPAAAPQL